MFVNVHLKLMDCCLIKLERMHCFPAIVTSLVSKMDPYNVNYNPYYYDNNFNPNFNYYGSQCFPVIPPVPQQTSAAQFNSAGSSEEQETTTQSETTAMADNLSNGDNPQAKKTGKRKAPTGKYDTFLPDEEKYLISLWKENYPQLNSKNSRKVWAKISEQLNNQYKRNKTVDKCQRKIKYLIDKYKERKDWNRKQTGANVWKSPHYDEIDSVLSDRDMVSLGHIKESTPGQSGVKSSSEASEVSSNSSSPTPPSLDESLEDVSKERKQRKKRKSNVETEKEDDAIAGALNAINEQGNKLTSVLESLQKSQAEQLNRMSQFMGSMIEMMKKSKTD